MRRHTTNFLAGLLVLSCGIPGKVCTSASSCSTGQTCVSGECRAGSAGGGTDSGARTGGAGMVSGCSPTAADNATRDTDCDGLSDAEEYGTDYAGKKTDPCNSDTDGDGLTDGLELGKTASVSPACKFTGDADSKSKTNATLADTDGDGLKDGQEDVNANGRVDTDEANPLRIDTDCDGYSDKQEADSAAGCATSPSRRDTDGDGLSDGTEGGLVPPGADTAGCTYTASTFDSDSSAKTNACNADSDGDGVQDGAEDSNGNGKVDPGELDPNNAGDAAGPATQACSSANLKPVVFHTNGVADVQIALPVAFSEVSTLVSGGVNRGLIFYDPATKIAGMVFSKDPSGTDGTSEEAADRAKLGTVTNPLVQTFTTWDGFATSVRASYELGGAMDVKAALNAIAANFWPTPSGLLQGTAGSVGPFTIQAEYVRRSGARAALVIALIPTSLNTGAALFTLNDTSNGTPLAQFSDFAGTQCEVFDFAGTQKVDFLWVVDDSNSMRSSQTATATAGALFGTKLQNAGLDWRVAGVSTGFYASNWLGSFRNWASSATTMQEWFGSGSNGFGIAGDGTEKGFQGAANFVNRTTPASVKPDLFRTDAALHFIFLTDTAEQSGSGLGVTELRNLMTARYPGQPFVSHGIVCPEGMSCGVSELENNGKYHTLVRNTGGVLGNIMTFKPATPTMAESLQQAAVIDAILAAAIGGTGHQLQRPPISSTIKVAVATPAGQCTASDVPRNRTNGWDIDAATRRLVFFGSCRPSAAGVKVAVSYKYWNENSTNPDGDACGATCAAPEVCDPSTRACVCPSNCGGCATGLVCNTATCTCDVPIF